ncbi:phosphate ABC transporter substrate-binding/OmpA family protein [Ruegeria sp. SCPT10]|uniref:phosphate ABC transporter substrate-binding/OmpA family protein n=1 Tax=Ruegeria sp. SCP10 TaxID=3141377 RepID=UPI00333D0E10
MTNIFKLSKSVASAIAIASALPTIAAAGQVELSAPDGSLRLSGEFLDLVDGHFLIKTPIGEMRVSTDRVTCNGEGCPTIDTSDVSLRIAGSGVMATELMPLLIAGYAVHVGNEISTQLLPNSQNKLLNLVTAEGFGDDLDSVLVIPSNSGEAFDALEAAEAEIGMSTRRIESQEARGLAASGAGNMTSVGQEHLLALESIAIVTHPDNPVSAIELNQLRDVYLGKITNWSQLNGPDVPIQVIGRDTGTASRELFESVLFDGTDITPSGITAVGTDIEAATQVLENPGAISFLPFGVQRGTKAMNIIDACGVVTEPNDFYAKTEEYPFVRRVYLYNRSDLDNDFARGLLSFAKSEEAEDAISVAGFTSFSIGRLPQHMAGLRGETLRASRTDAYEQGVVDEMLETAGQFDRLSSTFHFRSGSSRLDDRGAAELTRLVEFLKDQPSGTKIKLVGFSDDVGTFDSNRRLSLRRANRIAAYLNTEATDQLPGIEISPVGYGEIAPAACNLTHEGRIKNRRVEVWIESTVQG